MALSGGLQRTAFVGFDAGSPALVRELVGRGHLRNFARVLADGAAATVVHEPGMYVGSIWPSAMTGVGVARHGFYTGIRPAPGAYHYVPAGPTADPLWVHAGRAGRRIAVIDVPFFRAVAGLPGDQLFEWGCHDRYFGINAAPPGLLDEVLAAIGPHPIGMLDHPAGYERFAPCDSTHPGSPQRSGDQVVAFLGTLTDGLDRRAALTRHILARGPHDLIVDAVAETHCAGHHLWHLHDHRHPCYDAGLVARLGGDPMLAVYERADRILGEHLAALGEGTCFVWLSHGIRSQFDGSHLLNELLWRFDQAYRSGPDNSRWSGLDAALAVVRGRLPDRLTRRQLDAARRAAASWEAAASGDGPPAPPHDRRLWYPIDNNSVTGAVRFNRVGREPQGLLDRRGAWTAAQWLEQELRALVNLDTGAPVVVAVYPTDDLYERTPDDGFPDLFIEWNREAPIERVWSPTVGVAHIPSAGPRTGDHEATGELIAFGPGIRPGRGPTLRTVDIAATVAAASGFTIPDADGIAAERLLPYRSTRVPRLRRTVGAAGGRRPTRLGPSRDLATQRELIEIRERLYGLERAHHETRVAAERAQADAAVLHDIVATSSWIRAQQVPTDLRFSVVMPTVGRLTLLTRAVESVLSQSYPHLELVVVDDGSEDGTAEWLATVDDPRVVVVRNDARCGEGHSRNRALDIATGDVITFLDDDNQFDPDWVRSLAWLFAEQPDTAMAYGARVVDDRQRHTGRGLHRLPSVELNEWSSSEIVERNLVDMNTVAHRRSAARFDPTLPVFTDWDYLRGLVRSTTPTRFPVVAAYYRTAGADRATVRLRPREREFHELVRGRWRAGNESGEAEPSASRG